MAPISELEDGYSLSPLPETLSQGLMAVAIFGFMSFFTSLGLFLYLTYKIITWQAWFEPLWPRKKPQTPACSPPVQPSQVNRQPCRQKDGKSLINTLGEHAPTRPPLLKRIWDNPPNQFLVLIYNLLFADIMQASAFMLNIAWVVGGKIDAASGSCWAQGWFISTGDLAASMFITAIAFHTYLGVVRGYRPPSWAFYTTIALLWAIDYAVALLGVALSTQGAYGQLYVRAGAWCWIGLSHRDRQLLQHYLWIFLCVLITTCIYVYIFLFLSMPRDAALPHGNQPPSTARRYPTPTPQQPDWLVPAAPPSTAVPPTSPTSPAPAQAPHYRRPTKRHQAFLLYPIVYVLCTAPLAVGRIASISGREVSLGYFCFAGAMIASSGWLDVVLYSWTRRSLVFAGETPPSQDTGLETFAFMRTPPGRKYGNVIFVQGNFDGQGGGGGGGGRERECRDARRWHRRGSLFTNQCGGDGDKLAGADGERRKKRMGKRRDSEMGGDAGATGESMRIKIQCETITSVSVEVDPDRLNCSMASFCTDGSGLGPRREAPG